MATPKNMVITTGILAAVILAATLIYFADRSKTEKFQLVPKEKLEKQAVKVKGTDVGTGWSINKDPLEATKEAVAMALMDMKDKSPDFAIIFAGSGSDTQAILSKAKELFGAETKIYGGTSDARALITDKGLLNVTEEGYGPLEAINALSVMTVMSDDMVFGVGAVDFSDYPSARQGAMAAVKMAIKSSGKTPDELPDIIMLTPTIGEEEAVIEGIEAVVGKQTVLIGGTAGGPEFCVFGEKEVYRQGVSLAVIYTDLPIGWEFEGGFDVTDDHNGIVTEVHGQAIVQIDNRPALDVYDEWLNGEIKQLADRKVKPGIIRDLLTLHPIYRKYTSPQGEDYFLFSHPWPQDPTLKNRNIMTSTKIRVGEKINLSHGAWDIFINRIGNLPKSAKIQGGISLDKRPILGIGYICGGVMGVIPEEEREKIPLLINYSNNDAPFIANITWGEQGYFPGISNKHGNLLTSFLVIGGKGDN